jgi:hypothetical protein
MTNNVMTVDQLTKMAQTMVEGKMLGVNNVQQAVGLMLIAQAEGRHPATIAKEYHIINGKAALSAEAMLARFQSAGGKIQWTAKSDDECGATFSHPQGGDVNIVWNKRRAIQAGLSGQTWKKYPQQMLSARVIAEGVRTTFPGCIEGFYTPEEQEDIPNRPNIADQIREKAVIDVEVMDKPRSDIDVFLTRINEATVTGDLSSIREDIVDANDLVKNGVREAFIQKRDELSEGETLKEQNL